MAYQFEKHFTLEEARALLPQVRAWLAELQICERELKKTEERIAQMLSAGSDSGGETVNNLIKLTARSTRTHQEFTRRQIQVKDIDRGLVDFPALRGGREIFLCWEQDEEDIEFWHDIDTGYAGREKL